MMPAVYLFNPFAEAYIGRGQAFTPVKHQVALADDLDILPQYLCEPDDFVLVGKLPSDDFLPYIRSAGFAIPKYVELRDGRLDVETAALPRELSGLRPWAWGPDSLELLKPLIDRVDQGSRGPEQYFNAAVAGLYSKGWSAGFLNKVVARYASIHAVPHWLLPEQEIGIVTGNLEQALESIAAIRRGGHHRLVVKQAHGLAGHNAIRLWEPALLPQQAQWMARVLDEGGQLVIEPWLERILDFSVQLEMSSGGLRLLGFTGLINSLKGQFLANWAEPDYAHCAPANVVGLLRKTANVSCSILQGFYTEIFSMLETELLRVGFTGPVGIDCFVYRTQDGQYRLKPIVEINPRYTMGRLTLELMKHASAESCGVFRLLSLGEIRKQGFPSFSQYFVHCRDHAPPDLEGSILPRIRHGRVCLNDAQRAQVCLAVFEVSPGCTPPITCTPGENRSA